MTSWNPNWAAPWRVHNPMDQEGQTSYWVLTDEKTISLPEYVEGMAKNTMKRMYGNKLYRLVVESRSS